MRTVVVDKDIQKGYSVFHFFLHGEPNVGVSGIYIVKKWKFYFKLPYICHYSGVTQKRIRHLIKRYCNNLDIQLIFSSLKSEACLAQTTPSQAISVRVLFTNFHVQAVTLVTSVKPPVTFQHAYVSI